MTIKKEAFGVQSARFSKYGVDPRIGAISANEEFKHIGPGSYDITHRDTFGKHSRVTASTGEKGEWGRQKGREDAKKQKAEIELGPVSYPIKRWPESAGCTTSKHFVVDTLSERFADSSHWDTPGPGSYGVGGIPQQLLQDKDRQRFCLVNMRNFSKAVDRSLPTMGTSIGPGTYNFRSFADELIQHVVSKRGPYDLFSGSRTDPPVTGHFVVNKSNTLGPGQYELQSTVEHLLIDRHKKKHGQFSHSLRVPKRPPDRLFTKMKTHYIVTDDPGPGAYDPQTFHGLTANHKDGKKPPELGFLVSAKRFNRHAVKFFIGNYAALNSFWHQNSSSLFLRTLQLVVYNL